MICTQCKHKHSVQETLVQLAQNYQTETDEKVTAAVQKKGRAEVHGKNWGAI